MPDDHPFHEEIGFITEEGIAEGYPDGTYRPTVAVSRQAMVAFLHRIQGAPEGPFDDPGFDDVGETHPFFDEIAWSVEAGVADGFPDNTFRPTNPVSRQATAAFMHRLAGSPEGPFEDPGFDDVDEDSNFYDEIAWLAENEITTGYPDNTFRSTNPVTRQAMAAFIMRFLALADEPGEPANIELEPQDPDVNPSDTDHTITATVTDENGTPVPDVGVRWEVYEDNEPDAFHATDFDLFAGADVVHTDESGQIEVTYDGPGLPNDRHDVIVVCIPPDGDEASSCAEDDLEVDPGEDRRPRNMEFEIWDWAGKEWQNRIPDSVELEQEFDANFTTDDMEHTVSVQVFDQFGDALGRAWDTGASDWDELELRYVVFRSDDDGDSFQTERVSGTVTTEDDPTEDEYGHGEFTYDGDDGDFADDPQDDDLDRIVVCVNADDPTTAADADDCAKLDDGDIDVTSTGPWADIDKHWVDKDFEVDVPLSWRNEVTDDGDFGAVNDMAARHGSYGNATMQVNAEHGLVRTFGEVSVKSEIPGDGSVAGTDFHVHLGALDENGPVAIPLPAPEFVDARGGDVTDIDDVNFDEDSPFTYSLGTEADGEWLKTQDEDFAPAIQAALDAADAADPGDFLDAYLNVHTVDNPAGEVRGQLGLGAPQGADDLPPIFRLVNGGDDVTPLQQQNLILEFTQAVEEASPVANPLTGSDFEVEVNNQNVSVGVDNTWTTDTRQEIRIDAELEFGDDVTVTILESGANKIRNADDEDLNDSVLTRSFTLRADAMTVISQPQDGAANEAVEGDTEDHPAVRLTHDPDDYWVEGQDVTATVFEYNGDSGDSFTSTDLGDATDVTQTVTTDEDGVAEFDDLELEDPDTYIIRYVTGAPNYQTEIVRWSTAFDITTDPIIEITSLSEGDRINDPRHLIQGTAQAFDGRTIQNIEVDIDNATCGPVDGTTSWQCTPTAGDPFDEGSNEITATVTDSEGVTGTDVITIVLDTAPPVVTDVTKTAGDTADWEFDVAWAPGTSDDEHTHRIQFDVQDHTSNTTESFDTGTFVTDEDNAEDHLDEIMEELEELLQDEADAGVCDLRDSEAAYTINGNEATIDIAIGDCRATLTVTQWTSTLFSVTDDGDLGTPQGEAEEIQVTWNEEVSRELATAILSGDTFVLDVVGFDGFQSFAPSSPSVWTTTYTLTGVRGATVVPSTTQMDVRADDFRDRAGNLNQQQQDLPVN